MRRPTPAMQSVDQREPIFVERTIQLGHFEDPVGAKRDLPHRLVDGDVEHDDPRIERVVCGRHPQAKAQIDDRHALAANIDDAEEIHRRARHAGKGLRFENFLHPGDRDREKGLRDPEGHILLMLGHLRPPSTDLWLSISRP